MITRYAPAFSPALLVCAAMALLAATVWYWRRTVLRGAVRMAVALLRLSAGVLILWTLAGPHQLHDRMGEAPKIWLLTDASRSMDLPAGDIKRSALAAHVVKQAMDAEAENRAVVPVWFGSRLAAGSGPPAAEDAVRTGSRPAQALRELLSSGASLPCGVVLISDGAAQDAEALPAVAQSLRQRGVPVSVFCTGGKTDVRNLAITACDAPASVKPATVVPVTVTVRRDGCRMEAVTVQLVERAGDVVAEEITVPADDTVSGMHTVTLHCRTGLTGFDGMVRVTPLAGEISEADNTTPVAIACSDPKLRILYMEGTNRTDHGIPEPLFLADALDKDGGMEVDLLALNVTNDQGGSVLVNWPWKQDPVFKPDETKGYPKTREELYRYDVIICSDIPRQAFTKDQIAWTVDFVAERGGAFVMIGGKSSFGSGLWDQTPWDKLIPLDMEGASRGLTFENFKPFWPAEARTHPLLARLPLQPGETMEAILDAHPLFLGTNFVRRAKPAATVIMRQGDGDGMPIMAVEQFGKGRTMGFASDVTFFWGTFHNRAWGPPETAVPVQPNTESGAARNTPAEFYNNAYFRRFWVHAMQWLAEGSIRAHGADFSASTPLISWSSHDPLPVYASCGDAALLEKLSRGSCVAEGAGMGAGRVKLRYDAGAQRFAGMLPRPAGLSGECEIVVEASGPGVAGKRRATFKVRAPLEDLEMAEPAARPEVLEPLATITGGRVLNSAADVSAWLRERRSQATARGDFLKTPVWDRAAVLALILTLLSADWLLRRFYS